MRKKLLILLPLIDIAGGVAFKMTRPKPAPAKHKIDGQVYVLAKDFLVNLRQGRFAKLGVALIVDPKRSAAASHAGTATELPEGYGSLPQEAVVRAIITDALTDQPGSRLSSQRGRERLRKQITEELERRTDVGATDVVFTDVAVQ